MANSYQDFLNFQKQLGYPTYQPTPIETWTGGGASPIGQMIPKPVVNIPQPQQPQPQQQQPSGLDPHINPATGVWDDNYFAQNQPKSPWTSAPQGPSQADIAAIYQPGMDMLSQQEAAFRAEQPLAEQKLGTSYQEGLSLLDKNLSDQEAQLNKQGAAIGTAKSSALSQARQLYNELQQRIGAQFGSRSSAGPAAQELLGRETTKQFGNIESQSGQAQQDVEGERQRLISWAGDQRNTFLQKKNDALGELQRSFTQGLALIATKRGELESGKAAMRADLLNKARQEAQAIEAASVTYERNLSNWKLQQQAELDRMQYARQLQGFQAQPFSPSQIGATSPQGGNTAFNPGSYVGQRSGDYVFNGTAWVYQPA